MNSLFLLILLFWSFPAFATVYYVDYTNGNDSNSGTALSSSFKTMAPVTGNFFLNPGDHVEIVGGQTYPGSACTFTINSNGTFNNPIVIEQYLAAGGSAPIFNCASNVTTVSGWSGWTNTSGNIWESNVVIPFTVNGVIVDGTYNVIGAANTNSMLATTNNRWYQSSGNLFVRLSDNSDPDGHSIEVVGQYQSTGTNGIIQTGGTVGQVLAGKHLGDYVYFKNLETYGAVSSGFMMRNIGNHIDNSEAIFSGYASLYCVTNGVFPGCANNTYNYFTANYGSGAYSNGGENVVIEGTNTDFNNGIIENGAMAGYDPIAYNSSTFGSNNRIMNSIIEFNSQRSLQNTDTHGFDPQAYCDGCSYLQMDNDIIIGNSANSNYPAANQNAVPNIDIFSEHPSTNIPHDIYVHNVLSYNCNYMDIIAGVDSSDKVLYNVWVDNSTFYNSTGGFVAQFRYFDPSHGVSLHVYNNIFYYGGSGTFLISYDNAATWDLNNNDYFGNAESGGLIKDSAGNFYTVAQWQTFSGQDSNSINANPRFITNGSDFHLQRTSLGQANNSPGIGIALAHYADPFFNTYNLGTTRTDGIIDSDTSPDLGYHYNEVFGSSNNWNRGYVEQYN